MTVVDVLVTGEALRQPRATASAATLPPDKGAATTTDAYPVVRHRAQASAAARANGQPPWLPSAAVIGCLLLPANRARIIAGHVEMMPMQPTLETTIQFGDCDEAGIVFYPRYFYWMDSAFQGLIRQHGWNQRKLRAHFGTAGTPLVKATASFLAPATYDDRLTVAAGIVRWGNSSFEIGYKGAVDNRPVFEGWETRVWLLPTGGRPKAGAIPGGFRKALGEPTAEPPK